MASVLDLSQSPMSYEHHRHIPLPDEGSNEEFFEQNPFEVLDYLSMEEGLWDVEEKESAVSVVALQQEMLCGEIDSGSSYSRFAKQNAGGTFMRIETGAERAKLEHGKRIGFKTKSAVEILDDGYKWRKYGKKSVKNSPNPRNYYKCNTQGCNVKKRVERDREDPSYVLTIYDGTHNHTCPTTPYRYNYGNPPHSCSSLGIHKRP